MFWKSHSLIAAISAASAISVAPCTDPPVGEGEFLVAGPEGKVIVRFFLSASGEPRYSVSLEGRTVVLASALGIVRADGDFTAGLVLERAGRLRRLSGTYRLFQGKRRRCRWRAVERTFHLRNASGDPIDIVFRSFNDGAAFRYVFPNESKFPLKILCEATAFDFPDDSEAFIQPMQEVDTGYERSNPAYEEPYEQGTLVRELPPSGPGWVFPALFHCGGGWVLLTETAPETEYCGCRLLHEPGAAGFTVGFPVRREEFPGGALFPESTGPWALPWRVIAAGRGLAAIVESTLGTDLAPAARRGDWSYVKPGRASWSWVLLKDGATIFDIQKRFVDYASDMGWEYCLVDAGWDGQIGYEKIADLAVYAAGKKVGLILWYNSAGTWNSTPQTPRDLLLTAEGREREFVRIKAMGVRGVKVDFFGGDGQSMLGYYRAIIEDAARHRLLVNCHGATLPRGRQRTYPNFITAEAVKGFEHVTFDQAFADLQPVHCATLPFTRNVFDPMDYTPVCFSEVPGIRRATSNAFELALSVLFTSGVQHYAETPEGMAAVPAAVREFLKSLPAAWDEIRFLDGFPGKFVALARRSGRDWFAAGVNGGPNDRELDLDLAFLRRPTTGTLITDGADDRTFRCEEIFLAPGRTLPLVVKPAGGFVIRFGK
ncbi:MAG: glycoside hydrolase family 97 catalytic domain-containing protein [Spirochaetales bacterium]|nr:glycoside hydrolase family 97 catalytic domain-containing protein [Spirochaetales bacterium]